MELTEVAPEPLELDASGLRAYVLGSLAFRGSGHEDLPSRVQRALGWYRALAVRGAGFAFTPRVIPPTDRPDAPGRSPGTAATRSKRSARR